MSVLSWLFLASLNNRNPLLLNGGDALLQLTVFWGMFLSWGDHYSLDARKKNNPRYATQHYDLSHIGYILLLFSLYFFSALLKDSPEWRSDGTALYYAYSLDLAVLPLGKLIYPFQNFLKILTHLVWYTELFGPFLLLVPWKSSFLKKLFFVIFTLLHVGIGLTLDIGPFPIISIIVMIGILPSQWMDSFEILLRNLKLKRNITISYISPSYASFHAQRKSLRFQNTWTFAVNTLIAFSIILSLLWNFSTVNIVPRTLTQSIQPSAQFLGHCQYWGMFAPGVYKADGWVVMEGIMAKGENINIRTGKKVSYQKPTNVITTHKNFRYKKFYEHILNKRNMPLRLAYSRFELKQYNKRHKKKLIGIKFNYVLEWSLPNYKSKKPEIKELYSHILK